MHYPNKAMNIIVYTCVTNNYDWILPPIFRSPDLTYYCFTDRHRFKTRGWVVRPIDSSLDGFPPAHINRQYKMFPWRFLPEHTWSIYIDASVRILRNPITLIEQLDSEGVVLGCPSHRIADKSVRDEAQQIKDAGKIGPEKFPELDQQLENYAAEGFDLNARVYELGVILRKNTSEVGRLTDTMNVWWEQFAKGIQRDQLSFTYALEQSKLDIWAFPWSIDGNQDIFRRVPHKDITKPIWSYVCAGKYHGRVRRLLYEVMKRLNSARRIYSKFRIHNRR